MKKCFLNTTIVKPHFFSISLKKTLLQIIFLFISGVIHADEQSLEVSFENFSQHHFLANGADSCYISKSSTFSIHWNHTDPTIRKYQYRLFPHSTEWSTLSNRNAIAFFEIPAGHYSFQLEDSFGHTFESCITIDIPFLQRPWVKLILFSVLFLLVSTLIALLFYQKLGKARAKIENELKKAFNISQKAQINLPGEAATNVKEQDRIRSRKYQKVTVLFADIEGFTKIVEHINPEVLIDELDRFFFYFDEVVGRYGIEKIKTIGDAYMCAGGIPNKNRTNPIEVVMAAIEMQRFMRQTQQAHKEGQTFWNLRIGIHTGPVISGIVGQKKLSFDIWGDSVNIASRMESSGVGGEINISGVTYELVKDFFVCEYRGKMPIKYKGETDMYFVKSLRPELSFDNKGIEPNRKFFIRLQHLRYNDIEEYILTKIDNELLDGIFYHTKEHTIDVITQVEVLGRGENVSEEDLLLLKTAALLHDTGFLFEYANHEENSIQFASEILGKYNYSDYQIDQIIELIEVTKHELEPKNFLEKIIKDADLDYLGRSDFIMLSEKLYKENCAHHKKTSLQSWNKTQYEFMKEHSYYTATARSLRQVNKERQLQKLKELIEL